MRLPRLPLLLLALVAVPADPDDCALMIEANDRLQYDRDRLQLPADCAEVTLTLVHTGRLPVEQMGHNWVLARTADFRRLAQAGMRAGPANGYLPPGDERVIAATRLIGGGERAAVRIDVAALEPGGDYTYFCSFPGHYGAMNGRLVVD